MGNPKFLSNKCDEYHVPELQEYIFSVCDSLAQLALSHTCILYHEMHERQRLANLSEQQVMLDARRPWQVFIRHPVANVQKYAAKDSKRRSMTLSWLEKPATERELQTVILPGKDFPVYAFEQWACPPSISQADWDRHDLSAYKGVTTSNGLVLDEAMGIYDSMFGHAILEIWKIPASSTKSGFTVADIRDVIVGRYKPERSGGDAAKIYSKYWSTRRPQIHISLSWHMYGLLLSAPRDTEFDDYEEYSDCEESDLGWSD